MTEDKNVVNDYTLYNIDSRYTSEKEKKSDSIALMEARLERMKNLSDKDIKRARLMQLKLIMERYLNSGSTDEKNSFTSFLKKYIGIIYQKQNQFAKDVGITPVLLSQIINNHREPSDEFLMKLMVHSEKIFKDVGRFEKQLWYRVYFQDKISETMLNQNEWAPRIEKEIKITEPI